MPGTAESIRIDGAIDPFVPERRIDLAVDVDGLGFDAMTGYLHSAGLEETHQRGGLRLRLAGAATTDAGGATEGHLELEETLTLDGRETSQLGRLSARDLCFDPENRYARLGDVEISGTRLLLARDPSRRLVAFGLRTLGLGATAENAPKDRSHVEGATATDAATVAHLPRIELGHLAWTDSHLAFVDEAQDPPVRLAVEPITFELSGLTIGGEPGAAEPQPARLVAHAAAAGLFDSLALEGLVRTKLGSIDLAADLTLKGSGFQGKLVAPYLRGLGIEPAFAAARADAQIHAELRHDEVWRGSFRLHAGELVDGDTTVAKLGDLRIDDVSEVPGGVSIGRISIVEPCVHIERSRENAIRAGGLRFVGAEAGARADASLAPSPLNFPELPNIRIKQFALEKAQISLRDETVDPAVDADVLVDATANDVSTTGERGEISATVRIPGALESLEAQCVVVLARSSMRIDGSIDARGARDGPLARLLPPGRHFEMIDGRISLAGSIQVGAAQSGGIRAQLEARDLVVRDGAHEPALACKRAALAIPRFDPAAGVLEIGPASIEGLSVDAERDADGALRLLGLRIEDVRGATPATPAEPARPKSHGFERVELTGDLAFALERFRFRDASFGENARPVELGLTVRVPGPLTLCGGDPAARPAIVGSLALSVQGLVEECRIDARLRPFADEPALDARLAATGVRTQGLVEIVPALAARLRGDVDQGTLAGHLDARLSVRRGERAELGFDRPFGAEIRLDGLAFKSAPDGDVLAGVDAIAVDVAKVDLARELVHVKSVEVTRPRGLARRVGNALSICGLSIELVSPQEIAVSPPVAPAPKPAVADESASNSEVRIDRVLVSGVAAELRDVTREPAVVVPLAGLDVEAGPLSTRALREPLPIRFHAVVAGGVPTRAGADLKSNGANAAPVFDELVVAGDVALVPELSGWVQLTLTGLELPEVVALAPPQAVTVDEGSLDFRVRAKLAGNAGTRVHSSLTFTDLKVTEPPGGPIEKGLSLPVALDSALFLLRNPAGEQRFSVGFDVDEKGVSTGQIALAATEAFAQVLAVALVGAPLRLLNVFGSKPEKERGPRAVREIQFAAGSSDLPPDFASQLLDLRQQLSANRSLTLVVRHELGSKDVEHAQQLANPSADECLALVARARQRKAELLRGRAEAAAQTRALLAMGARSADDASAALRAIDRELAAVEDTLDGVLDILRSTSARQAAKRTRVAALEIAGARLDAVAAFLRTGLEREAGERLDVRAPQFEVQNASDAGRIVVELRER